MSRELDINAALDFLSVQYALWNKENGLNLGSAHEHMFDEALTLKQREWIADYGRRWERVARGDLVEVIARTFSRLLGCAIGDACLRKAALRNAMNPRGDVCHSHDFCDANMVMCSAFLEVLRRDVALDDDADMRLWDNAWNLAVDNYFWSGVTGFLNEEELETILIIAKNGQSGRITEREIRLLVEAYREHVE